LSTIGPATSVFSTMGGVVYIRESRIQGES
jgi:hypothetical protein